MSKALRNTTPTRHADDRATAIEDVARETLGNVELGMEHPASEYTLLAAELRRALEFAYDRGAAAGDRLARMQAGA